MNNRLCLHCSEQLLPGEELCHLKCIKKFYHSNALPSLPYGIEELGKLAENVVMNHITIPGVQPKISMHITTENGLNRFTIVGLWGRYILKPPVGIYPNLPENESLTMKMAALAGIKTVPNSLIPLKTGELSYITERIDRTANGDKIQMEDMCQLTGRLTEHKYHGSYEQVAGAVKKYSTNPLFDITELLKVLLFSFITGNNDMHLKNFSLIENGELIAFSPAYDLLCTRLVIPEKDDPDETALTLNGKKRKLVKEDFMKFSKNAGLTEKQFNNIFQEIIEAEPVMTGRVEKSFLPENQKCEYKNILAERIYNLKR
ncbi:MAG TPA: HipA domain-containing protein [Spirochaetota bacterium]|nr:HipA domain-containing protein [Spirochaetota bacterium]